MIQARLQYILVFALGTTLLIGGNMAYSFNESPMKRDIMRTVLGAVEMAKLVKKNKYDEHVLTL